MFRIVDTAAGSDYDDGRHYATADEAAAAVESPDWDPGYNAPSDETFWIDYDIRSVDDGETARTVTIAVHPAEPRCSEDEHDWQDGPVRGDGAGVRYTDTCRHCGVRRVTESQPQRRDTGAYAPTARISYRDADGEAV